MKTKQKYLTINIRRVESVLKMPLKLSINGKTHTLKVSCQTQSIRPYKNIEIILASCSVKAKLEILLVFFQRNLFVWYWTRIKKSQYKKTQVHLEIYPPKFSVLVQKVILKLQQNYSIIIYRHLALIFAASYKPYL